MSRNRRQARELIADLASQLIARLISNGIDKDFSTEIGLEVADKISEHWGGQNVYFPFDLATRRNALIYAEFTGDNHAELALKFGTSMGHIYRVIKTKLAEEKSSRQPTLFSE